MLTQYDQILLNYETQWHALHSASPAVPINYNPIRIFKQCFRFWQLKRKLNAVCKTIVDTPNIELESHQGVMALISLWLNINAREMSLTVKGNYIESTETFVKRVKSSWPSMDDASVFQALRNVWIMNAIQMMADKPIELTDAMFAYSMLYPLTDNLMDDASITASEKKNFVIRFGQRLRGEQVRALSSHETDVFDMVALIEKQYPRAAFKEVYDSLLLIHDAQLNSLKQQYESLSKDSLLHLTFNKGAASVVADGYLVLGKLSVSQLDFLSGYGIVLQLADDLQDMFEDKENGHSTLFTNACSTDERWQFTRRLMFFSGLILEKLETPNPTFQSQLKVLLGRSMQILISDAIFEQKHLFTQKILRSVGAQQAIGLEHHARLKKIAASWMERIKTSAFASQLF